MSRILPSLVVAAALPAMAQSVAVNLRGIVTDSAGAPVSGATVKLEGLGTTATSGQDGSFTLAGSGVGVSGPRGPFTTTSAEIRANSLVLALPRSSEVTVTAASADGRGYAVLRRELASGSYNLPLAGLGPGVRFLEVEAAGSRTVLKAYAVDGALYASPAGSIAPDAGGASAYAASASAASASAASASAASASGTGAATAKRAAALYDVITSTKTGFQKAYVSISNSDSSGIQIRMLKETSPKFSFFVTSMRGLQELAKNDSCFGGDYRFGETGPGAGLRGADKICATLAEKSMKGSGVKGWRAFLSVTADASNKQVNAADRIGAGPWYDRNGRLLASNKTDLINARPKNGDPTIANDLPNEYGIPNHRPDPNAPEEDNHHTVTGSDTTGKLKGPNSTCKDWTASTGVSANGKPACGLSWPRSLPGGGGPGGGFGGSTNWHWIWAWDAPGCGRGIEIVQNGPGTPGWTYIGTGGGYGGFYCFALNP